MVKHLWVVVLLAAGAMLLFGCGRSSEEPVTGAPPFVSSGSTEDNGGVSTEPDVQTPAEVIGPVDAPADVAPVQTPAQTVAAAPDVDEVVATVNGRPILRGRYEEGLQSLLEQYRRFYAQYGQDLDQYLRGSDGSLLRLRLQAEAMRGFVRLELLDAEAERRDIVVTSSEIEERFAADLTAFLEQAGITEEEFVQQVEAEGGAYEAFLVSAKESTGIQLQGERVRAAVVAGTSLTDEEIAAFFDAHRSDYEEPEQVRASHILVGDREAAEELLRRLDEGDAFADLAEELSEDEGSAVRGGDLGWFGRGDMVSEFDAAAFALQPGERSEIVETAYGYHVILLTDRREGTNATLEEIFEEVRADALAAREEAVYQEWFATLEADAEVEVHLPVIAAALLEVEDPDAALAGFEQAVADEVDDPYLQFYIGQIYETKLRVTREEQAILEAGPAPTEETLDRIEALGRDADAFRRRAIDAYELALAAVGVDEGIQARLQRLQAEGTDQ